MDKEQFKATNGAGNASAKGDNASAATVNREAPSDVSLAEGIASGAETADGILFPALTDAQTEIAARYGVEEDIPPLTLLFEEGKPVESLYVLRSGKVRVTRIVAGGETTLALHGPGDFTGDVFNLSEGALAIATGRTVSPTRVIRFTIPEFKRMLNENEELREIILPAFASRRPEADRLMQQREKLAALGKMSAGLAHELNNPASAARRAAGQLRALMQDFAPLAISVGDLNLTGEQRVAIAKFKQAAANAKGQENEPLGALARSDREDEIGEWLDEKGVAEAWDMAPTLVDSGITVTLLGTLARDLPAEALGPVLSYVTAFLGADALMGEIEQSSARIADLVTAIKSYSYMDQAPRQEINIHKGLDATLTILNHKFKRNNIGIVKQYACEVPKILAYGGELNQVWTNILDNAVDALVENVEKGAQKEPPRITIRTSCECDEVLVEIADNGPGVPDDVLPHLFEPFYTTKGVGKGTGLGLDISHRIVTERHNGDIRVFAEPGMTCFAIRIPTVYSDKANASDKEDAVGED